MAETPRFSITGVFLMVFRFFQSHLNLALHFQYGMGVKLKILKYVFIFPY